MVGEIQPSFVSHFYLNPSISAPLHKVFPFDILNCPLEQKSCEPSIQSPVCEVSECPSSDIVPHHVEVKSMPYRNKAYVAPITELLLQCHYDAI